MRGTVGEEAVGGGGKEWETWKTTVRRRQILVLNQIRTERKGYKLDGAVKWVVPTTFVVAIFCFSPPNPSRTYPNTYFSRIRCHFPMAQRNLGDPTLLYCFLAWQNLTPHPTRRESDGGLRLWRRSGVAGIWVRRHVLTLPTCRWPTWKILPQHASCVAQLVTFVHAPQSRSYIKKKLNN